MRSPLSVVSVILAACFVGGLVVATISPVPEERLVPGLVVGACAVAAWTAGFSVSLHAIARSPAAWVGHVIAVGAGIALGLLVSGVVVFADVYASGTLAWRRIALHAIVRVLTSVAALDVFAFQRTLTQGSPPARRAEPSR